MQYSAQKRVFNNYSIGLFSFIISFILSVITVPILLNYWGNDAYGIWLALFAGFSLLQTFDFGHQSYIGNLLNVEYHIDKQKFSEYLGSSLAIAYLLGFLQVAITFFLIISGYLNIFLGITNSSVSYTSTSLALLSLILMWAVTGSVGGVLVKILIPAGYMVPSIIWGIIFRLSQFLSLILIVINGGNILLASIFYSIVQSVLSAFLFIYIKNKMPEFYPWWKSVSLKTGFNNLKKSSVLTINNLLQQLSNNGLILFITNIFSTAIVPAFTTVRTLTNTATVFTNLFITSIQPDLIKYHAKKESEKLQTTLNANWFFSGLVVNIGLITVIPFADYIFKVWTKGIIDFDFNLFISLAASISVINFGAGLYNYIYGINYLKAVTVITITKVIILFLFSYYLSGFMGLSGIGVAVLISEIFSSMILPYYYVQKIFKSFNGSLDIKSSFTAAASPIILVVLASFSLSGMEFSYYIWGTALSIVILTYIFNWLILDIEVKNRSKNLLRNLF